MQGSIDAHIGHMRIGVICCLGLIPALSGTFSIHNQDWIGDHDRYVIIFSLKSQNEPRKRNTHSCIKMTRRESRRLVKKNINVNDD